MIEKAEYLRWREYKASRPPLMAELEGTMIYFNLKYYIIERVVEIINDEGLQEMAMACRFRDGAVSPFPSKLNYEIIDGKAYIKGSI